MIVCTHCGKAFTEQRTICPSCGASLPGAQINPAADARVHSIPPGEKGAQLFPFDSLFEKYIPQPAPIYDRIYTARPVPAAGTPSPKAPAATQEKVASATPLDTPSEIPAPPTFRERFFPINTKRSLLVEIMLSLFLGIFGVGWLLIGNKRAGTFLLVSSLIFYAPLLIVSYALAYSSYGVSILCTGPFITGAVALNAFILHKTMQYKQRKMSGRPPASPLPYTK